MKICDRCGENHGVVTICIKSIPPGFEDAEYDLCEKCRSGIERYVAETDYYHNNSRGEIE